MSSDKNQDVLEKQLKTLGQKIRIDILKKLSVSNNPLPYSSLRKEVLGTNPNSINFSFHLKALKNSVLIESSENGYNLSILGRQILKNIVSIEQILNDKNKTIMIRTSKYSKEPFDANKIETYLIKEGEVEKNVAKQIAGEVEERLSKTNIDYLTAPLMREYINAILLENGQEEIRHKLTRLGTPPFEALKHFKNQFINPEYFLSKLGSDVSEQFLLLNLLPKNLADLYLSGDVVLLNLNYWSLRPLGLFLDTKSILNYVSNRYSINFNNLEDQIDRINLILHLFDTLAMFAPYFSEDLLLSNFSDFILLYLLNGKEEKSHLQKILIPQVLKHSKRYYDTKSHLSLELSCNSKGEEIENSQRNILHNFIDRISYRVNNTEESVAPLILFDYNSFPTDKISYDSFVKNIKFGNNFIFYNKKSSNLFNSTLINVHNTNGNNRGENTIILDKILINLHKIAQNSKQNDTIFFDILQERLASIFELFTHKKKLINRKLSSSNPWNRITSEFFDLNGSKWIDEALKSISFFGLNEAIKTHCGIEIDRIEKSESFAFEVLGFMNNIIKEKNHQVNENFILTQPHNDSYLQEAWHNNQQNLYNESKRYRISIIREESKLSLKRKIKLYEKFETHLEGGCIFTLDLNNLSVEEQINNLINSKLNAFQLRT